MQTLIDSLREIVGSPEFYDTVSGTWDYAAMCEYLSCVLLVIVVVASVFRILGKLVSR